MPMIQLLHNVVVLVHTLDSPCTLTVKSPNDLLKSALRSYQCGANTMFRGLRSSVQDKGQNYGKKSA